jgi:hypothetical protein
LAFSSLVLVLDAQVGVAAQLVADVRRGEQVELQAGAGGQLA